MINLYHLARSSICYTDEFVVYALSKVDDLFFFFFSFFGSEREIWNGNIVREFLSSFGRN